MRTVFDYSRLLNGSAEQSTSEQGVPLRSAFDYIGGNLSVINEESGARPEPGRFLRVAQKSQVDNWLQTSIVALGINGGGLTNVPPSLPSPPLSAGIPSMQAAQEVSEIIYGPSDEDNLFDLHVAESFLTKACQSYDQHQFDAASRYLKRGIKHTQRLSMDQKQQLSTKKLRLGDMKLLYARSLLHCGEFQDAEDALLMIIEEKVQNGFDAIRVCQALQDLALLCLHKGNANAAINHCRQAANRCLNTNSLGNGSASYFESLRLLALAMWADGNAEEAYDYAELLPNDFMLDFTDIDRIMANEMFFITKTDKPKRGRPESDDSRLNGLKTTQMASVQSNTPSPGSVNPSKEPAPTAPSTESQNSPSASSQSLLSSKVTPSISSVMQQPKDGDRHASIGSISQYTSRETIEASPRRLSESYKLRAQKILKKQGLDGDSKTDEAFFWAAKSGELLVVDLILEKRGMNASMQYTEKKTGVLNIGQSVTFTGTILHVAVKYKRYDVCKRLLEASFPVDVLDTVDNTPLDCLCDSTNPTSHDMSICGLLLDHGANIEHRHYRGGITPLLLAAGRGNVTICEYLISKGAQINAQDNGGRSALYFAVSGGHLAVCSLLSGHSAELDLPDKQGYTPMMKLLIWASSKDSTYKHHSTANSICDLLVRNGADVNPVGPFGRTALLWATYYDKIHPNCRFSIVKCLIEGGADVNAADDYGHTALIYLLKNSWDTQNFETFLKLLLEKGARVDVSTRDGKTPYNLLPRFDLDKSKISRLLKSYEEKNKRLARDAERTLSTPSTSTT